MIGMILLAVIAVLIFFGLTDGYFRRMGVANWVAFLAVLVVAVAAVFPPLITPGNVSLSYAGFFLPILLCAVCAFAIGANLTLLRASAALLAVAGVFVATRISLPPMRSTAFYVGGVFISGAVSGITAYIICKNRLAILASVLGGAVLGDFIAALLFRFATGATGNLLVLGQNGIFDAVILGAAVGAFCIEVGDAAAKAIASRRSPSRTVALQPQLSEMAQDNDIPQQESEQEDDLYDDYFNDDAD